MSYFRFDINDATGDLDANRPVPFRLTPNISEFLTTIGVSGPLTASMIAVARCFAQPNFKVGQPEAHTGRRYTVKRDMCCVFPVGAWARVRLAQVSLCTPFLSEPRPLMMGVGLGWC